MVRNAYDLILIDCPPNLHLCSWAALTAADQLIIPLQPEDYGAQGFATCMSRSAWYASRRIPSWRYSAIW